MPRDAQGHIIAELLAKKGAYGHIRTIEPGIGIQVSKIMRSAG